MPALLLAVYLPPRPAVANAVSHDGVVYVSLRSLLDRDFLDGEWTLAESNRVIDIRLADRRVRFEEGGDRVAIGDGEATMLRSPVLVLDGRHYVPAEECAAAFGYAYQPGPTAVLVSGDRRLGLDVEALDLPHRRPHVGRLVPVHRGVVLTRPLEVRRHLHGDVPVETLATGTALLVRREVTLDDTPHVIVTRCDPALTSYAVAADALRDATRDTTIDDTHLGRVLRRLSALAGKSAAIDHGRRADLPRTVALTVDLCWSLLPAERDFFRFLPRLAAARGGEAPVTLFVTGRWLEQYPLEVERLIALSREPGVNVTWSGHSWVHPKRRPFMNAYAPDEVRADALRVEAELLRWGIVPSVFYRFPGLVHDEERLRAVLALDLVSVDCDSWAAAMHLGRPPHRSPPRDGSILLVHGNGNEPPGLARFYEWLIEHPEWRLGSIERFVADGDEADAARQSVGELLRERRRSGDGRDEPAPTGEGTPTLDVPSPNR